MPRIVAGAVLSSRTIGPQRLGPWDRKGAVRADNSCQQPYSRRMSVAIDAYASTIQWCETKSHTKSRVSFFISQLKTIIIGFHRRYTIIYPEFT
jgi:hypothetical protein